MADPENPDNPNEDERPEWLPSKFETPEALAKSYGELERQFTQTQQRERAMEENFQTLSSQLEELQTQRQSPQVDPSDAQAQLYAMYETDPLGTMALLAQNAAGLAVQQQAQSQQAQLAPQQQSNAALVAAYATNEMKSRYADFDQERDRIREEVENNPLFQNDEIWANPQMAVGALEQAYTIVKGKDMLAGVTPVFDTTAAKRAAQTATGGNPRPDVPDEAAEAWERVRKANNSSYQDMMSPRT